MDRASPRIEFTKPFKYKKCSCERFNRRAFKKKCNLCGQRSALLPIKGISNHKNLRKISLDPRCKQLKSIYSVSKISNEQSCNAFKIDAAPSSSIKDRSHRRIFSHPNSTKPSQIPSILGSRSTILFSSSSIRSKRSPLPVHKGLGVASCPTPSTRNKGTSLSRRLDCLGQQRRGSKFSNTKSCDTSDRSRVFDKSGKIRTKSFTKPDMVRHRLGRHKLHMEYFPSKKKRNCCRSKKSREKENHFQTRLRIPTRQYIVSLSGSSRLQTDVLRSCETTAHIQSSGQKQVHADTKKYSKGITTLDKSSSSKKSSTFSFPIPRNNVVDGCLRNRLGSHIRSKRPSSGIMEQRGIIIAHNRSGNTCSDKSNPAFESSEENSKSQNRQRGRTMDHQQEENAFGSATPSTLSSNFGVSSSPDHSSRQPNSFNLEHNGRLTESKSATSNRMAITSNDFQNDRDMERTPRNRLDGHSSEFPTTTLRNSIRTPECSSNRCDDSRLEQMETDLHISPGSIHQNSPPKVNNVQTSRSSNSSMETEGGLVPIHSSTLSKPPTPLNTPGTDGTGSIHQKRLAKLRQMDRIQFLEYIYTLKYGKNVAKNLIKSHRDSTKRQAQCVWRSFKCWLPEDVDKLSSKLFMEFLIYLQSNKELSARTILNYRSCLSLPIKLGFNIDLSGKTFSLLARSQFLQKPVTRKLYPQWQINPVLEILSSERFCNNVSKRDKLLKTLFLVSLAIGNRVSEIAALTRDGIIYPSDNTVTIPTKEGFLFKNQSINRNPPPVNFPAIGNNDKLCPKANLLDYLEDTKNDDHEGYIFCHPQTGKTLRSGRISYWITQAIKLSSVNNLAKAHDVRKYSHSLSWTRGVPICDIIKHGFWQSKNTFINKYLVPVENVKFQCVAGRNIINASI